MICHSINWPNVIISLTLILENLGNMCIAIVYCPFFDVINFEITLALFSSRFLHNQKSQGNNINILKTKRAINMK